MAAPLSEAVRIPMFALALTIVCAGSSAAQTTVESFADLPKVLKPGIVVFVQDKTGQRTKGTITALSGSALELRSGAVVEQTMAFPADRVTRVTRVDSRLNGFLIGLAAGGIPGAYLGVGFRSWCVNESGSHCDRFVPITGAVFGLIGGGIGFAIDGAIDGQTLVFARRGAPAQARVTPMFGDHLAGVRLSLTF